MVYYLLTTAGSSPEAHGAEPRLTTPMRGRVGHKSHRRALLPLLWGVAGFETGELGGKYRT